MKIDSRGFRNRPFRSLIVGVCCVVVAVLGVRPATGQEDEDAVLRRRIPRAVQLAQAYLAKQQEPDGGWGSTTNGHPIGLAAICVLALASSGQTTKDVAVAKGVEYLRRLSVDALKNSQTYDKALVIMALAAVKDGNRDLPRITQLAEMLEKEQLDREGHRGYGGWAYGDTPLGFNYDNSNSQFAVLGLREAAYAGVPIDEDVLKRSRAYWLRQQVGNKLAREGAGWNYKIDEDGRAVSGSMTVAGISSLAITSALVKDVENEATPDGRIIECPNDQEQELQKALEAGIRWVGTHPAVNHNPGGGMWGLYYLYGLERAGRLSGRRYFGRLDWFRAGASYLVKHQQVDGSWMGEHLFENDPNLATSFCLLFLSKGMAPVLINKLQYGNRDRGLDEVVDVEWNLHPHDVRNLTDHIMQLPKWPRQLNWQVVDLQRASSDEGVNALLQAPVQLISGSDDLSVLSDKEVDLLREYIVQGGFLFLVQNCSGTGFDQGVRTLVQRLFPQGEYRLEKLPPTHDIYRSEFLMTANPPELWGVNFGCKTTIVYAPFDHGRRWDLWARHNPKNRHLDVTNSISRSMQLGVNVIAYATGRELLDKTKIPKADELKLAKDDLDRSQLSIARLKHSGGWDVAPNALRHLLLSLGTVGLKGSAGSPTLSATDAQIAEFPLIYMHGRNNYSMSAREAESLKLHLERGGTLFADACCGATKFDESFRAMVQQMFGKPLEQIPVSHEMFHSEWAHDIRKVRRRVPVVDRPDAPLQTQDSQVEPFLEGVQIDGRYVVIYSKYDISCALERQSTPACAGYVTEDAARIAVNVVLYSLLQDTGGQDLSAK